MIKAKKHFGQNFLKDKSVLKKITQAISKDTNFIVEIGPGLGDLTQELVQICALKAYEIDKELIPILEHKFKTQIENQILSLENKDAAKLESFAEQPFVLVANLPYYVASNLILKALEDDFCEAFLVMVQKEVALKFAAKSDDSDFCALSVLASLFGECEVLFDVEPECFEPAPKVMSSVLSFKRTFKKSDFEDFEDFKNFLRLCFSAPRKQLLKVLKSLKEAKEVFNTLNIASNARAHQLSVRSYLEIFKKLKDK